MTAGRRVSFYFLSLAPFLTSSWCVRCASPACISPSVSCSVSPSLRPRGRSAFGPCARPARASKVALAGALWLAPFVLVSLLWVGIVAPWVATPPENLLR